MDLLRESRPSVCNRTRYVPRAKTPAFSLTELPKEVKKERSKKLTDLFKDISKANNQEWIGWKGRIIIDEYGKHSGTMIGRNDSYKTVVVEGNFSFGDTPTVEVYEADTFCLFARVT